MDAGIAAVGCVNDPGMRDREIRSPRFFQQRYRIGRSIRDVAAAEGRRIAEPPRKINNEQCWAPTEAHRLSKFLQVKDRSLGRVVAGCQHASPR
jgi:hypothetical protein